VQCQRDFLQSYSPGALPQALGPRRSDIIHRCGHRIRHEESAANPTEHGEGQEYLFPDSVQPLQSQVAEQELPPRRLRLLQQCNRRRRQRFLAPVRLRHRQFV
jgi:hypothetical protein